MTIKSSKVSKLRMSKGDPKNIVTTTSWQYGKKNHCSTYLQVPKYTWIRAGYTSQVVILIKLLHDIFTILSMDCAAQSMLLFLTTKQALAVLLVVTAYGTEVVIQSLELPTSWLSYIHNQIESRV